MSTPTVTPSAYPALSKAGIRPRARVRVVTPGSLRGTERDAMYALFAQYYEAIDRASFIRDLEAKDEVIVLTTGGDIVGFSTVKYFQLDLDGRRVEAIFSGDTVVRRDHWGRGALQWGFTRVMFARWVRNPFRPLYWFLISKGFRTYLLLTNNFAEHYPRFDRPTPPALQRLIDVMGSSLFQEHYDFRRGLIDFGTSRGQLRARVADPTPEDIKGCSQIAFFVERNPTWQRGTELPCIGRVSPMVSVHYGVKRLRRSLRALRLRVRLGGRR